MFSDSFAGESVRIVTTSSTIKATKMRLELPEPISQSSAPDLGSKLVGASSVSAAAGPFQFARYRLTEGASRDVQLLVVDSGNVRAAICPTRLSKSSVC